MDCIMKTSSGQEGRVSNSCLGCYDRFTQAFYHVLIDRFHELVVQSLGHSLG